MLSMNKFLDKAKSLGSFLVIFLILEYLLSKLALNIYLSNLLAGIASSIIFDWIAPKLGIEKHHADQVKER